MAGMSDTSGMTDVEVLDAISKAARFKMPSACREMYKGSGNRSYADLFADVAMPLTHAHAAVGALIAERDALRQACWEARAIMGFDNDGCPTPAAVVYPTMHEGVVQWARELRKDYDDACAESDRLTAEVLRLRAAMQDIVDDFDFTTKGGTEFQTDRTQAYADTARASLRPTTTNTEKQG